MSQIQSQDSTDEAPHASASSDAFPSQYDPKQFEDRIYAQWESAGVFHATPQPKESGRKPYCVMIPPPNVTGVLHIGHALNNTLQDILVRYRRMTGRETLWMPGTDHAGIATQNVVERQIAKLEGKTRYQLGRDELIERIDSFVEFSGGTILKQLRKLGASCDWSRTRYTMDPGLSRAVRQAFVNLYESGLLYRGKKYLVNWCPRCRTTLSDDEVEHEDVKGKLYELHYPLADGSGRLTVATTRPETMLGDTAVAVHPDDARYTKYVGTLVELPLTGRKIPVIADSALELGFGTGCLKVTPAHDPVDYQIGQRHNLPVLNIFTESGSLNEHVPQPYQGLDRFKARDRVVADLRSLGLVGEIKDHPQKVGHCYRCHTIVEPYLTAQWFVSMKPLSELAVKATEDGRVKFHPERWTKVYLNWFKDVRDWPVSRQIWFGHRLPVWYDLEENADHIRQIEAGENEPYDEIRDGKRIRYLIGENATPIVSVVDPSTLPENKNRRLIQEADVLDTWFSSSLWPFGTLGWPEQTDDLKYFYPTDTLVTSRGIIYFWVARMVMMGEKFLGQEPFRDVVIHGTLLDGDGQVMSKSKGNGIDPLDIIARYGADAMRYTLADMSTGGQDLKFPVQIVCPFCNESQELSRKRTVPVMLCKSCKKEFQQPVPNEPPKPEPPMGMLDSPRFEKGRNFANKVWNASRFVLTSIDAQNTSGVPLTNVEGLQLGDIDRWLLSRLNSTIKESTRALDEFEFSKAADALYGFFWNEFCAWYIELSKPRMAPGAERGDALAATAVLLNTLDRCLRLLHPLCPFVSEALWAELNTRSTPAARNLGEKVPAETADSERLLARAAWPAANASLIDPALEAQFESLFSAVAAVRAVRQELIDNSPRERKKDVAATLARELSVTIQTSDANLAARLTAHGNLLARMAITHVPTITGINSKPPHPASATAIKGGTIYVTLDSGLLDVERLRLQKEIRNCEQYIPRVEGKLNNPNFVNNAPPELVEEERGRLAEAQTRLKNLRAALASL